MPNGLVWQTDLTGNDINWQGYTTRVIMDLTPIRALVIPSGYQAQVRIKYAAGNTGWDIAETFIGNESLTGNEWWIEESSPVRVTFSGSNSVSLGPRALILSDWISFVMNKAGTGLVVTVFTAAATNDQQASTILNPGTNLWYTVGNEAGIAKPASTYTQNGVFSGIAAIEMDGFGVPSRTVRLQSWYQGAWR